MKNNTTASNGRVLTACERYLSSKDYTLLESWENGVFDIVAIDGETGQTVFVSCSASVEPEPEELPSRADAELAMLAFLIDAGEGCEMGVRVDAIHLLVSGNNALLRHHKEALA